MDSVLSSEVDLESEMESKVVGGRRLPAGVYFIGDPMCVLDGELWHDDVYMKQEIYDKGLCIWTHKTHWGDGVYYDQYENKYGVDSASIGAVHIDQCIPEKLGYMHTDGLHGYGILYHFDKDFDCSWTDGVFCIGHFEIDTREGE